MDTVCEMQPRSSLEPQGNFSSEDWVGFFPPGTAELADSATTVYVPGLGSFQFIGDPWPRYDSHTRATDHVRANLKRTAGPEDPLS